MKDDMSMDALCRLCGSEEGIRVNIFEPGTEHVKKIHKILPITVNEHDPFPKSMCHRCSFKVSEFFEFRTNCLKAQELFKSRVPWLRDKKVTYTDETHSPMVEVPLNSVNAVSPNEKRLSRNNTPVFVDENEPMIVIDDDSPPSGDNNLTQLSNEQGPQQKIIMKFKMSDVRKKSRRSIWDTKKRKRKSRKSCQIAEVFTTSIGDFQNINDFQNMSNIENDPLSVPDIDKEEDYTFKSNSPKNDHSNVEKGILTDDKAGENMKIPNYILVTNIPRVGLVYTCEKCGRTFLSPQPASIHNCDIGFIQKLDEPPKPVDEHVATANPIDVYNCNKCGKVFSRHSQLIVHERKHDEVRHSSSDDTFTPFNQRKKQRSKKKTKPRLLNSTSFLMSLDCNEPEILRHSLLSSDSE